MPRRPQKRTAERRRQRPQSSIAIDPLVGPGNPRHRHPPRAKTDQPRSRHCMVHLATRTSSHRSKSPCQAKYATVMLGATTHQIADAAQGLPHDYIGTLKWFPNLTLTGPAVSEEPRPKLNSPSQIGPDGKRVTLIPRN